MPQLLLRSFQFDFVRELVADQNQNRNRRDAVQGMGSRLASSDLRFDSMGQGYVSIRDNIHNMTDCKLIHFAVK